MRTIRAIYKLELKLLLSKKIVGLLIFLLLVSFSCVQVGINKYKTVLKTITDTQRYERSKIKKYQYYGQYGTYGEIVFFQPSAQSIYFNNSSTISELTAGVDAGERLKLYNSFKGRSLFTEKSGGFMDFSGIMLLFGSGLALLLGYQSFFHKDYLRFMAGIAHKGRLFFALLASRVTLICLFLFCAGSLSLLQLLWNAVELHTFPYSYQLIYMGMVFLVGLFFYLLGTLAGSFKSRLTGFIWITSGWFVLIFFIPSGLNYFIYSNAENIESEGIEKATFDILMKFEKEMKEKIGTPNESNKHLFVAPIKAYLEKEFKQIQALEKKLETGMKKNIIAYQRLAMWLPSTFYLSAGNEISSKGYGNFIKFYKHIRVLKKQFVLYIVAKGYAGASATVAKRFLDSFFKKNEGIFKAEPGLPAYFLWGILLMVFYISGLTTLSYHCFKKALCL